MSSLFNSWPYPDQRWRFLLIGVTYVALWIGTWYSARLLESLGVVSLWFLPAGLRFFGLLIFGWPGVLLELAVQLVFALMQIAALAGPPITEFLSVNTLRLQPTQFPAGQCDRDTSLAPMATRNLGFHSPD